MRTYRPLTTQEIKQLQTQNCFAEDWSKITVAPNFSADFVHMSSFSGSVSLGYFSKTFTLKGGIEKHSGIRFATFHNVTVGNDCLIENVQNYIANYTIGDNTFIENVNVIMVDKSSAFGNDVEVSVLNETGGREVPINNLLSAHLAYIISLYRHRPVLISKINKLINAYRASQTSTMGSIGSNVMILNTGSIEGVKIGDHAYIEGACRLVNGSINSNVSAPIKIGYGVVCEDFIISSGSEVTDGVMLTRCFVGQSCHISRNYSASDSLFFSNCHQENGEACAIFAGPYTVTHHKSTLLISGMFSFMNAGSGSNQSNHMYKLGPIHQGTLERGSKTTSDSYILWPARIGAFSLVMGRHFGHTDSTKLPFSYLIEQRDRTYLVPGVNLKSVGTIRDAQKWPKRDLRKDPKKLDQLNYNLLSPYTIQKMFSGIVVLEDLKRVSGQDSEIYFYDNAIIKNRALYKGLEYYRTGITKFLGNSIIKRLENIPLHSNEDIRLRLLPEVSIGEGEWVDISGLIAPKSEIERLTNEIETTDSLNLVSINEAFESMHQNYYIYEWAWAYSKIKQFFNIDPFTITAKELIQIVNQWKVAVIELDKQVYADAKKEFSLSSMTGFGADGTRKEKKADFEQVRGDFESNPFVIAVEKHIEVKRALGDDFIAVLSQIS